VGTTFATATPNLAVIVSGNYDELTGLFNAGTASAINNDYLFQFNGVDTNLTVNNIIFTDISGTLTATSATGVVSFIVA
jgi:hypothetical protein